MPDHCFGANPNDGHFYVLPLLWFVCWVASLIHCQSDGIHQQDGHCLASSIILFIGSKIIAWMFGFLWWILIVWRPDPLPIGRDSIGRMATDQGRIPSFRFIPIAVIFYLVEFHPRQIIFPGVHPMGGHFYVLPWLRFDWYGMDFKLFLCWLGRIHQEDWHQTASSIIHYIGSEALDL